MYVILVWNGTLGTIVLTMRKIVTSYLNSAARNMGTELPPVGPVRDSFP